MRSTWRPLRPRGAPFSITVSLRDAVLLAAKILIHTLSLGGVATRSVAYLISMRRVGVITTGYTGYTHTHIHTSYTTLRN